MNEPQWLYGVMHFEDGVRPVLLWRGRKFFHAFYIDSVNVQRRFVLFKELKYFKEEGDSDDDLFQVKKRIRLMLNKSPLTGLAREMTKVTKKTLKAGLEMK